MKILGKIAYILGYPVLFVILNGTTRTRVVVMHNNQVVLVRPVIGMGEFLLPGGGVHRGESTRQSAIRELREETGIEAGESELEHLEDRTLRVRGVRFSVAVFSLRVVALPRTSKKSLEIAEVVLMSREDAVSHMHPQEAQLIAGQ